MNQNSIKNFTNNIYSLACSNNSDLSECALEILSCIFQKRSSPKLSEEFFMASTQRPEFNIIEMALNILRENYSKLNFKEAWMVTNSQLPSTSSNKQRLNKKEQIALDMLNNVFSNKYLLEHLLKEDGENISTNIYAHHLTTLFKSEHALDKCIATLCVSRMVQTLESNQSGAINPTSLMTSQLLHSNPVKSMIESSLNTSMPDYDFRDQVRVLEDRMNMTINGKTSASLSSSTQNWLNPDYSNNQHMFVKALILSSAFAFFIHAKRPKSLKLLTISKTMIRAFILFSYTVVIGNYRPNYQSQSEQTHLKNNSLPLREYIQKWNQDQLGYYFGDVMLFLFMYGFVRNWFAFLPFPLILY